MAKNKGSSEQRESKAARAWKAARRALSESDTLAVAEKVLRSQGFSAVSFAGAPAELVARAITAAEDELEMRQQGSRIVGWRLTLRDVRRSVE